MTNKPERGTMVSPMPRAEIDQIRKGEINITLLKILDKREGTPEDIDSIPSQLGNVALQELLETARTEIEKSEVSDSSMRQLVLDVKSRIIVSLQRAEVSDEHLLGKNKAWEGGGEERLIHIDQNFLDTLKANLLLITKPPKRGTKKLEI